MTINAMMQAVAAMLSRTVEDGLARGDMVRSPGPRVQTANGPRNPIQQRKLMNRSPRADRRAAAKRLGVLPGWRDPRNRYVTQAGQHVVLWPKGQLEA